MSGTWIRVQWLCLPWVLGLALGNVGCLVERPSQARWDCTTDADCSPDFLCVAIANGARTCARTCTDGTCNEEGTTCITLTRGEPLVSVCVAECQVTPDGRETVSCPLGFHCARSGYPASGSSTSEGRCVPDTTCQRDADCGEGRLCTSSLAGNENIPNMVCIAAPDARGQCPTSSAAVTMGETSACLPTCAQSACPSPMTCYVERGRGFGLGQNQSVCYLGMYGAPCERPSDCFVGQCLNVAGRFQCTEPCDAPAVRGDCANLSAFTGPYGAHLVFTCDTDATGRPTCLASGGVGHICRNGIDCRAGLFCADEGICTKTCERDADCLDARFPPLSNGWCSAGICAPRLANDAPCRQDRECVSGLCYTAFGTSFVRTCSDPRPVSDFCTRDRDCASNSCPSTFPPRTCQGS